MADIWEEGARQVSEQYGIPKYVTDYKDLIASPEVDAVLICSPTDQVYRGEGEGMDCGIDIGVWRVRPDSVSVNMF